MLKVAVYCRVSTDKDDQKNSFEGQKQYFTEYINYRPDWELVNVYADEGITGTSTKKRKEFNMMIHDAKCGLFDLIITKEVSRFARNTVDVLKYTRELKELNIGVLFINDNINTLDKDGELRLTIMASIAQEESRKTSERVKWGQQRRMEQGIVFGRNILGYNLKNGVLTINEEEAQLVRHIYNKYLEGKGLHIIAKELQKEGYKTKNGHSEWTNKSIRTILQNEKYVGDLIQKKTYTPNYLTHEKKYNYGEEEFIIIREHHEPIIDRKTFDYVQSEFKRKSEVYKNDKNKHSNRYAFSGKIKCGCCGRRYVATFKTRKDGSKRKKWNCYNNQKNGKLHDVNGEMVGCNNKSIGNEVLESAVLQALNDIAINKQSIVDKVTKIVSDVISFSKNEEYNFKKTTDKIKNLEQKKLRNIDTYNDMAISRSDFLKLNEMYQAEIDKLNDEIKYEKEKASAKKNRSDLINKICSVVNNIMKFEVLDETVVKEVLEQIIIHDKSHIDVYLKGHEIFFTYPKPILDNKYLYQSKGPC